VQVSKLQLSSHCRQVPCKMIRMRRKSANMNGRHPKTVATVKAVLRNLICIKVNLHLTQRSWKSPPLSNKIRSLIRARIKFLMSRKTTINLASTADLRQPSLPPQKSKLSLSNKLRTQLPKWRTTTRISTWMKASTPSKIDFLVYLLVNNSNYNFTPRKPSTAHTNTSCL
jgi:hypothetical protein